MKRVKITVVCRTEYPELMAKYENPLEEPCCMTVGDIFVSENAERPDGMCSVAWDCMYEFVKTLSEGGGNFFDGWMKNPYSAMVSCNDGFRPVSYLLEAID
jgi:uncharacterized repeat protein (TIGR04076 family)